MAKHFIKVKEDFRCRNCAEKVVGSGYTNHCPSCLYSLHTDEGVPGDRMSKCKGLMEPVEVQVKRGRYSIVHMCQKCKKKVVNKISEKDNFEEVLKIAGN